MVLYLPILMPLEPGGHGAPSPTLDATSTLYHSCPRYCGGAASKNKIEKKNTKKDHVILNSLTNKDCGAPGPHVGWISPGCRKAYLSHDWPTRSSSSSFSCGRVKLEL